MMNKQCISCANADMCKEGDLGIGGNTPLDESPYGVDGECPHYSPYDNIKDTSCSVPQLSEDDDVPDVW